MALNSRGETRPELDVKFSTHPDAERARFVERQSQLTCACQPPSSSKFVSAEKSRHAVSISRDAKYLTNGLQFGVIWGGWHPWSQRQLDHVDTGPRNLARSLLNHVKPLRPGRSISARAEGRWTKGRSRPRECVAPVPVMPRGYRRGLQ